MTQTNSSAASANNEATDYGYAYFSQLPQREPLQAARSATPAIRALTGEQQVTFLTIAINRILQVLSFRLESEQSFLLLDFASNSYGDWRTADWRVFFLRVCQGYYGILEAYDRQNPQIILSWMRAYEADRTEAVHTAQLYELPTTQSTHA